jgi:hypothetical protein
MHVNISELRFGRFDSGAIAILSIPSDCRGSYVLREAADSLTCDDSFTPEAGHEALAERHGMKTRHLQDSLTA